MVHFTLSRGVTSSGHGIIISLNDMNFIVVLTVIFASPAAADDQADETQEGQEEDHQGEDLVELLPVIVIVILSVEPVKLFILLSD